MTMESFRVQILKRKLIKPSNPTPPHLRNLKLSLFDQLTFPVYVHVVFYYTVDGDENKEHERCDRLEKSLSKILSKFYPLAGRFVKDDFLIDCSDQGVEFFEAQVNGNLVEFLQHGFQMEISKEFLPWDDPPAADLVTSPLLAIQINTFNCGGVALGIRISHTVIDASSLMTFVNEWASTCQEGGDHSAAAEVVSSPIMYHKFSSLFPARLMLPHDHHLKLGPPGKDAAAKIVLGNFLFEGTTITTVKEKVTANCSLLHLHPSRLVVVTALIWKALMSVSLDKHGKMRDSVLNLIMNLRGKAAALPTAEPSFGNFWTPVSVLFEENKAKMELHDLMSLLMNAIENARTRFEAAASTDEIPSMFNIQKEEVEMCCQRGNGDVDIHIFSSWCRLPMYEVDFGWGKPSWIGHAIRNYEGICLMDTKDGDGIEAWISLEEKDMIEFKRNLQDIIIM